jgi:hypothetical protein
MAIGAKQNDERGLIGNGHPWYAKEKTARHMPDLPGHGAAISSIFCQETMGHTLF